VKRYQVPGWPARQNGVSAVTPNLTRMAGGGAQQYKDGLTGQPGTQAIPVDPVVPSPDIGDLAQAGVSRSGDAPNVFYPNLYWARPQRQWWPGAGMPVSVRSDNLMPVPAADPRGVPGAQQMPLVQRGQGQIQSRPNLPRWAALNAT
jgi:hypothetical protein